MKSAMQRLEDLHRMDSSIRHLQFSRAIIFLDEWLFYWMLFAMVYCGFSLALISTAALFGALAIYTSYANYEILATSIGLPRTWTLWPFL